MSKKTTKLILIGFCTLGNIIQQNLTCINYHSYSATIEMLKLFTNLYNQINFYIECPHCKNKITILLVSTVARI